MLNKLSLSQRQMVLLGWVICFLAAVFYCYEYILRIIPGALRLNLFSSLHLSTMDQFGWLTTAYLIGYTPLQLFVGYFTDRYGSRRMLIMALSLCVIGSFIFMSSHALWPAIVGRVFVGAGSAFAFVAVLRLTAIWLDKKYFSFFVGLTTALGMIGAAFGYSMMTAWVQSQGAHTVILYSAIFGLILIPVFFLLIHEKPESAGQSASHENQPSFWLGITSLLRQRQVMTAALIGGVLFLSLAVMSDNLAPAYMQVLFPHLSKQDQVSISRVIYFGWLVGAPLAGCLTEWFRSRRVLLIAGALCACLVITALIVIPMPSVNLVKVLLFLFGLFSSVEILCFTVVTDIVAEDNVAMSMSVVNFIVMTVSMCVMPLISNILDLMWSGATTLLDGKKVRLYSLHAYHVAFAVVPILYFFAVVLAFTLSPSYNNKGVSDELG